MPKTRAGKKTTPRKKAPPAGAKQTAATAKATPAKKSPPSKAKG